jgi:hypothetical protein
VMDHRFWSDTARERPDGGAAVFGGAVVGQRMDEGTVRARSRGARRRSRSALPQRPLEKLTGVSRASASSAGPGRGGPARQVAGYDDVYGLCVHGHPESERDLDRRDAAVSVPPLVARLAS